ncbi:MAG: hypothetical protein ACOYJS_03240 [Acutalibacteraceae bacterium]
MYYCKNCGFEFLEPQKTYETHNLSDTPFEVLYLCPNCKSRNFYEKNQTHCRCCGAKLSKEQTEYCSDSCRTKGALLWKKELKKRRAELINPLNMIVKECRDYNKANGTNYSYGQYVAIIKPRIFKEQGKCAKKRKNT